MDADDGGNWFINRNKNTGEYGCYTRDHNSTRYEQILLDPGQQIEDVFPYTLGKITYEIRSAHDPWLLSMILTEDTNNFGLTAFELRFVGFGLLFCCGGLTIQPICWIYSKFKRSREIAKAGGRSAAYHYDMEYEDDEAPSSGLQRGAPPINSATLDPSNGGGNIVIQNEMSDLDAARVKNTSVMDPNVSRNVKRVKRKGEYESYYYD